MQNTDMGAPSGASVLVPNDGHNIADFDQWRVDALASIEAMTTPENAEDLLKKIKSVEAAARMHKLSVEQVRAWKRVALVAERKWGELLGPAKRDHDRSGLSGRTPLSEAEKTDRKRARRVAAVAARDFNDYLKDEGNPSREDLLRKHAAPQHRPKVKQKSPEGTHLWEDEAVLSWVAERKKAKRHRDDIVAESKADEHDWPLPGKHLPQNAADRCLAILKDRDRAGRGAKQKEMPKESGKRLHGLHAEKRAGRSDKALTMQLRIAETIGSLEGIDPVAFGLGEVDQEMVAKIHDDLSRLTVWLDSSMKTVIGHMDDAHAVTRIEALRAKAESTPYPGEAESLHAKADELERKRTYKLAAID